MVYLLRRYLIDEKLMQYEGGALPSITWSRAEGVGHVDMAAGAMPPIFRRLSVRAALGDIVRFAAGDSAREDLQPDADEVPHVGWTFASDGIGLTETSLDGMHMDTAVIESFFLSALDPLEGGPATSAGTTAHPTAWQNGSVSTAAALPLDTSPPLDFGLARRDQWARKLLRLSLALAEDTIHGDKFRCPIIGAMGALCLKPSGVKHVTVASKMMSGLLAVAKAVFVVWGNLEMGTQHPDDDYDEAYHRYIRPTIAHHSTRSSQLYGSGSAYVPVTAIACLFECRNISFEECHATPGLKTTSLRQNGDVAVHGMNSEVSKQNRARRTRSYRDHGPLLTARPPPVEHTRLSGSEQRARRPPLCGPRRATSLARRGELC